MIDIHSLSSSYGPRAVLKNIDLRVNRGEFLGVLGPNGSGKTTLLKALTGLLPSQGAIRLDGRDLGDMSSRAVALLAASVSQQVSHGLDMKVESLVLMGRYARLGPLGSYSDSDIQAARQAMHETDTLRFADRRAQELSGGELQRVLLARAFAQQTPVLLLDEPSANLDMARSIEMFDLLHRKNQDGITVVAVIHDVNLAALYCRRMAVLKDGALVADGTPQQVLTAPLLKDVYGTESIISRHPVAGVPQVSYLPGVASNRSSSQG